MTSLTLLFSIGALLIGVILGFVLIRRRPRKRSMKTELFEDLWFDLQQFCRTEETWPNALIEADRVLDKALRKKRFRGKSMGERLVAAQRYITDNDDIWDAHNLVKRVIADQSSVNLKERDVKEALISFKLALIDLGALPSGKPKDS